MTEAKSESTTVRVKNDTKARLEVVKLVTFLGNNASFDDAINAAVDSWEEDNLSTDELLDAVKDNDDVQVHKSVCGDTIVEEIDDK